MVLDLLKLKLHVCSRVPEDCPQALADLVERCSSADPTQRPFAGELLELLSAVQ